jgi:hypothetical protein
MPLVVIGIALFAIWLVLNHIRKQQITKELINLQKLAMEKGLELPNKDLLQMETGSKTMSLRVAIIAFCLGLAMFAIFAFIPEIKRSDRDAIIVFQIIGALLLALGLGNFLSWLFIDRKR